MSPILGSRGISPRGYGFAGAGKPNAPVSVVATNVGTGRAYNNGSASVAFSSGGDNGAPISSFTVTSSPSGLTASGASSPLVVTGLASGTSYTFTVTATNSVGTSNASSASSAITATTVPQAPTIGTPTCASGQSYTGSANITVNFTAGATGGAAVSTFTATSSSGGTATAGSTPVTISQTVGSSYTYTVTATNANGTSTASGTSSSVLAASVPQAPTIGTATAGNTNASVTFSSNATGGSAITSFTTTSSPSGITASGGSPVTVSGLSNGTAYTFTTTATNAFGTSAASGSSNSVTPFVPIIPAMYIMGGEWNPTNSAGGAALQGGWTKRNTGTFRFDTETASTTVDNLVRFWAKPASVSNPGVNGYVAGGFSAPDTGLTITGNSPSTVSTTLSEKLSFSTATWSANGGTVTATVTSFYMSTSIENGATGGYIITDAGSTTGGLTTVNVNKLNYSNETFSNVRSWTSGGTGTYNVPYSYTGFGFQGQNNTPEISNPGTKAYLRGNSTGAVTGNVSFYHWSFSTDNYSTSNNTATSAGGSTNHQFTNGTTAGYTFVTSTNTTNPFFKLPFSTETWASTSVSLSANRFSPSARGYTAGGAAYITAGQNLNDYSTNTEKLTFSTDTRSVIAQTCAGVRYTTSLASAH
jgi:hypothetical protein